MDIFLSLVILAISGSTSGKIIGNKIGELSSYETWNLLLGILGGIVMGSVFQGMGVIRWSGGLNPVIIIGLVVTGGFGGALAVIVFGYIKRLFSK